MPSLFFCGFGSGVGFLDGVSGSFASPQKTCRGAPAPLHPRGGGGGPPTPPNQPTKHTTKSLTLHPPHKISTPTQNISHHSRNTTQSTTTLLATYYHPISPKKSLITQPAKLIDTQLYQKQHHTHHTNKLTPHLQTNHLPAHPTSPPLHQPHQTHNTITNQQLNQLPFNTTSPTKPPHQTNTKKYIMLIEGNKLFILKMCS